MDDQFCVKKTLQHLDQCKDAWITFPEMQDIASLNQPVSQSTSKDASLWKFKA